MPKILKRLTSQLKAKGFGEGEARAIATSQLQKHGILKKGSEEQLTAKGEKRNSMTPGERAKDRQAKASGTHKASDYKYNSKTNQATLKNGKTR